MADSNDGFKIVDSAFRRKPGRSIVDQRNTGFRDLGTVTNTEGAYVIENIAPGKYQIEVNYVGIN